MKLKFSLLLLNLLLPALAAQAQVYKWVGPDGKVQYSDKPPSSAQKGVEKRTIGAGATDTTGFPPDLAQAARNNPVTLYTAPSCGPCATARSYLKGAGIPYAEKTVMNYEDGEKLKQVAGDMQLPALLVGSKKVLGLDTDEYKKKQTDAGYPDSNKLPKEYRYPAAEPAAPAKAKPGDKPAEKRPEQAKPESNFRF